MMTQVLDEDEKFPMEIQENIVEFVKETLYFLQYWIMWLPFIPLFLDCQSQFWVLNVFFITMVHLKMPSLEKSGLISSN